MKKRDEIYVSQILERINLIQEFLKGKSLDFFLKSYLHRSAVIRELEVIGEAARLISNDTKNSFPTLPWRQMIGMRNRLIHEYFIVDDSIVWEVAQLQLPNYGKIFKISFLLLRNRFINLGYARQVTIMLEILNGILPRENRLK